MNAWGAVVKEPFVLKLPPQHLAEIGHLSLVVILALTRCVTDDPDDHDDDGDWPQEHALRSFHSPAVAASAHWASAVPCPIRSICGERNPLSGPKQGPVLGPDM
jgi:hypothetical protein